LLQLVSWSLTSLFSTNMAISETNTFASCQHCNHMHVCVKCEANVCRERAGDNLDTGSA